MKRTYRSKKETGGALDHREVLLNMDEKSSAFDAFYIQNLKQTKRELSCVGSSNAYGVASKKKRKRKYVKRIVKDVENVQPRESMSTSTYLTPDKSIRVNKILDPFDMLLYSSYTDQVAVADNNNCVLEKYVTKKEEKTYTRKNSRKVTKYNYSSEYSSDSDKENTSNTQSNMTDIRTHKLLVEKELSNSPKSFDESINKIVKNLSLINNFKHKTANSFNTSYKHHRNRLLKNCQSPILQKSPLCSTPFKDKYRGKSIYNFSPISSKERESPNLTITEENNESSNSIIFLCKEKVSKPFKKHKISPLIHASGGDYSAEKYVNKSLIYDEIDPISQIDLIPDVFGAGNVENYIEPITNNEYSESVSEPSLVQITQADPFLGFSDDIITESVANDKINLLKCIQAQSSETEKLNENNMDSEDVNLYKIDKSNRDISLGTSSEKDNNINTNDYTYKTNLLVKYVCYNKHKDDMSDCSIENYSKENENLNASKNITNNKDITLEKAEDVNILDCENELSDKDNFIKCHNSDKDKFIQNLDTSNNSNETSSYNSQNSSMISQDSDKESMYDTCNSEQSFSEENINNREPKVAIERLNDSVFIKYYEKMLKDKEDSSCGSNWSEEVESEDESQSDVDESQSSFGENQSKVNESEIEVDENLNKENNCKMINKSTDNDTSTSLFNCSQYNKSIASKDTQSHSAETPPNPIIITDSSTTEDIESNDEASTNEEVHVSFVTTRRRNEISYDSMFIFDNSYGSSSTDCDKTVLSNEARLSCFKKSDSELDISIKAYGNNKTNKSEKQYDKDCTDRQHRNTRRNSRLTKQNEVILDMDSSIKKVTNISTGEINDGGEDKNAELFTSQTEIPEHSKSSVTTRKSSRMFEDSIFCNRFSSTDAELKPSIVLQPGKKWERSLSIYKRMTMADLCDHSILEDESQKKGRKYRQSVISTMEMQDSLHNESINSRRSTFISKPSRSTIRFVKDSNNSRLSLNTTEVFDDLKGFLTEECDDTVIELSKLSLADSEFDVTVLDKFDETSERIATARDYVLRRCNQTDPILFDECYPETVLKNCHKIGEGVYGEVFLWRGRDGRARVMKIVPIAGAVKVNGETQKDFHEVISEIVIAMELSALRAPIADIDRYFDEGKDGETLDLHSVENATDVFNEVLAVRCVQGPYPSRLLDLWELYDECKGSENDNPAALPADQQYMVLELANAGQDLESYQFTSAQQAHALFQQIAFGLAVGEESFQFEHRDLHWGNVLIAPTEQKLATFVLRGRSYRVPRGGVCATIIDYSLSRVTLPLAADRAALYNDLGADEQLFDAVGDYQFQVYRLMRDKLGNDWKSFEPYTNILWLHYTVDKMITALRYKRTNTKIHKHYIEKLKGIKDRILAYKSATEYVLTDIEI